jgi:hypothetical protein
VFLTTTLEAEGFHAPIRLLTPPFVIFLVGAIELSYVDNLLTSSRF